MTINTEVLVAAKIIAMLGFTPAKSRWVVKTANYVAQAGDKLAANTTAAGFTITLPAGAAEGDEVAVRDYAGTWATHNLTINGGGHTIDGASTFTANEAGYTLTFTFMGGIWIYAVAFTSLGAP